MGLRQVTMAFAVLLLAAGPATADDSALNKEGFWTVGRGDAKSETCMASLPTKAGPMLLLQAVSGEVGLVVGTKAPMRRGKAGVLRTEAYSFEFEPDYNDARDLMFSRASLDARAQAALKLANGVVVGVDGREVFSADLQGTGIENALEAVIACSKGEKGWWGPGVAAPPVVATKENDPGTERPLHKDGVWTLAADGDGCSAAVPIEGGGALVLIAANGGRDIMVGAGAAGTFKRGRKGRLEVDDYRFDFKPTYEGDDYLQFDRFLDSDGFLALRRARALRIAVDGREEVNVVLDGSGFPDVFASLQACARGETGWWGEGAKLP
jgi:hypothetical protein